MPVLVCGVIAGTKDNCHSASAFLFLQKFPAKIFNTFSTALMILSSVLLGVKAVILVALAITRVIADSHAGICSAQAKIIVRNSIVALLNYGW